MTVYGLNIINSHPGNEKMSQTKLFTSVTDRDVKAFDIYSETYDDIENENEIDVDFTPKKMSKAEFLKKLSDNKPVIIQSYDYRISIETFSINVSEQNHSTILKRISHAEFLALKKYDTVYLKIHDSFYMSVVCDTPSYNADADEPGVEVETTNGFADEDTVYVLVR